MSLEPCTCTVLSRLARNEFDYPVMATTGPEIGTKILPIDDRTVKAQIWDTGKS